MHCNVVLLLCHVFKNSRISIGRIICGAPANDMEVGKIRMLSPPFENLINSFVGSDGAENQGDGLFLVEFECGSGSAFKDRRSEWWRQISEGNGDNFFRWDGKALADDLAGSLRVNEDASGEAIGRPGYFFSCMNVFLVL